MAHGRAVADLSALGFLALSQLARRDVTVALSGQGADELLGGTGSTRCSPRRLVDCPPRAARRLAEPVPRRAPAGLGRGSTPSAPRTRSTACSR